MRFEPRLKLNDPVNFCIYYCLIRFVTYRCGPLLHMAWCWSCAVSHCGHWVVGESKRGRMWCSVMERMKRGIYILQLSLSRSHPHPPAWKLLWIINTVHCLVWLQSWQSWAQCASGGPRHHQMCIVTSRAVCLYTWLWFLEVTGILTMLSTHVTWWA